jgi:hypothetical protein
MGGPRSACYYTTSWDLTRAPHAGAADDLAEGVATPSEGRNLARVATPMSLGSCDGSSRTESGLCQA